MSEETQESQPSVLDALESAYEPDKEWSFRTAKGNHLIRVRAINDLSEQIKLERDAQTMIKTAKRSPLDPWKPFLPAEDEVIQGAFMMSKLLIEPQVNFIKALQWAKERGGLFMEIAREIAKLKAPELFANTEAQIEAEGEGSGQTDTGAMP